MFIKAEWLRAEPSTFEANYVVAKNYHLEQELFKEGGYFWKAPVITVKDNKALVSEWGSDALHWSRVYEYPHIFWGMLPIKGKILDAGGGRSIFQFFISREAPEAFQRFKR